MNQSIKPNVASLPEDATAMRETEFTKLRSIVYDQTGITIGETRRSMLMSRLNKRLRELGLDSYKAYISLVQGDADERQELINRVTTNETYFYRTPRIWTYFHETVVPDFISRSASRPLRFWSAAASTGEEAHTAGILLEETRLRNLTFDYTILGTDISSRVLDVAQEGVYKGRPVARFRTAKPELFGRFMEGSDEHGWKVRRDIKTRIRFQRHNLLASLRNSPPFDVIFLRNVLIYFTHADQARILSMVRQVLHPDGLLFIGESESLKHIETDFDQVAPLAYKATSGPSR